MPESETKPRLASPQMVMASEHYLNQQLAEEVAERAKDPLSEAKRPGGFFLRADGTPVDAENREIPDEHLTADEKKAVAAIKKDTKAQADESAEAEKERQKLAADAAKVQAEADKKHAAATAAAIEAGRARGRAEMGGRRKR